jgi:hypothetical protein
MRVTDTLTGLDTEMIGPILAARMGEVFVFDGRLLPVAEVWSRFTPAPEQRYRGDRRTMADRRTTGERRRHRTRDRRVAPQRRAVRRFRDILTENEILQLVRGPEWVRVIREEGV